MPLITFDLEDGLPSVNFSVSTEDADRFRDFMDEYSREVRRLNWLEEMANKEGGILLHDGSEVGRLGLGLRPGSVNRTLREAIDDAS